jgi:hypothetical protein
MRSTLAASKVNAAGGGGLHVAGRVRSCSIDPPESGQPPEEIGAVSCVVARHGQRLRPAAIPLVTPLLPLSLSSHRISSHRSHNHYSSSTNSTRFPPAVPQLNAYRGMDGEAMHIVLAGWYTVLARRPVSGPEIQSGAWQYKAVRQDVLSTQSHCLRYNEVDAGLFLFLIGATWRPFSRASIILAGAFAEATIIAADANLMRKHWQNYGNDFQFETVYQNGRRFGLPVSKFILPRRSTKSQGPPVPSTPRRFSG